MYTVQEKGKSIAGRGVKGRKRERTEDEDVEPSVSSGRIKLGGLSQDGCEPQVNAGEPVQGPSSRYEDTNSARIMKTTATLVEMFPGIDSQYLYLRNNKHYIYFYLVLRSSSIFY